MSDGTAPRQSWSRADFGHPRRQGKAVNTFYLMLSRMMTVASDQTTPPLQPIDWGAIFSQVNCWRGACMHHFSMVETAVTETLLALSATAQGEIAVRLRHLIGQRFEDLAAAISPGGPFEEVGRHALTELSQYREKHETFRTLLCHGMVKVTVEQNGQWILLIRSLSIRSRQPDRTILALEQSEAEARLATLKRDGQKLTSCLGQLRKVAAAA
ncbi:hypothetical protein EN836_29040 [Mesorhizobium sp. M1C.F.Ca.ET.193.01.1.1]|uniref:hypothetical protein n=1 Tax=unclassified Mesorhizobium TaxID=325217 RepID=UPI000FD5EB45|nr:MULTISPECIES: hypothetical protein [unclassified Mesorhizobium]TGS92925.1 hypothetical protein EN820_49700 [bacterium M00.F.Ca.ET.177.01.1.1]TGQ50441.1 hypothetical protein EN853_29030 [Mesorhizobium sp. M1C.F.Ca.ET.210.01.1.1]TGQ65365.1 hypothetical protein EN855_029045 [Mesorhizobium sp. M1C.F.Ca.ET.212.01.1.1]TGQ99290.1 hypothetical protein EN847_29030 [Mesorhizobium sp. M1C.F.Ca.ET.204.01.1.1]TGR19621.1 hypothetical protein EN839_29030 [Mesorhizobium sp. M1C.F.Ca.ET.196.01.1.1]